MARPNFPGSIVELQRRFPDEAACRAYLFESRWPDGYRCPRCGSGEVGPEHRRHLWQCKGCGHQTSVTAETVMHRIPTRSPNRRRTPMAAFQTLLGLGAQREPATYRQTARASSTPLAELTG